MNEPAKVEKQRSEIIFEFPRFLFPPHFGHFHQRRSPPFRKTCQSKAATVNDTSFGNSRSSPSLPPISPFLLSVICVFPVCHRLSSYSKQKHNCFFFFFFFQVPLCMPTSAHPSRDSLPLPSAPLFYSLPSRPYSPRSAPLLRALTNIFCLIVLELSLFQLIEISKCKPNPHSPISLPLLPSPSSHGEFSPPDPFSFYST